MPGQNSATLPPWMVAAGHEIESEAVVVVVFAIDSFPHFEPCSFVCLFPAKEICKTVLCWFNQCLCVDFDKTKRYAAVPVRT